MKYYNYLKENKDSKVAKALDLDEPEVGKDYAPEKVERYIKIIDDALGVMKNKEENDANDAIVTDLREKKKSWQNVDKETKPKKTKTEPPVPPPEDQEQDQGGQPPPQFQQQQQQQESKIKLLFKKMS